VKEAKIEAKKESKAKALAEAKVVAEKNKVIAKTEKVLAGLNADVKDSDGEKVRDKKIAKESKETLKLKKSLKDL
jgi:hypothetical protein